MHPRLKPATVPQERGQHPAPRRTDERDREKRKRHQHDQRPRGQDPAPWPTARHRHSPTPPANEPGKQITTWFNRSLQNRAVDRGDDQKRHDQDQPHDLQPDHRDGQRQRHHRKVDHARHVQPRGSGDIRDRKATCAIGRRRIMTSASTPAPPSAITMSASFHSMPGGRAQKKGSRAPPGVPPTWTGSRSKARCRSRKRRESTAPIALSSVSLRARAEPADAVIARASAESADARQEAQQRRDRRRQAATMHHEGQSHARQGRVADRVADQRALADVEECARGARGNTQNASRRWSPGPRYSPASRSQRLKPSPSVPTASAPASRADGQTAAIGAVEGFLT
jgi:hypothetical protein